MDVECRWPRERFASPARVLARRLLGALLVRRLDDDTILGGRIVETEAYVGTRDAASHAFAGHRSPRNESMYAQAGTAYVYFTYGMHYCFNIVCAREGVPEAVLIRALEPMHGVERMAELRGTSKRGQREDMGQRGHIGQMGQIRHMKASARDCARPAPRDEMSGSNTGAPMPRWMRELCAGPARLCQALAIDRGLDAEDLVTSSRLYIADAPTRMSKSVPRGTIITSPRVGIDSAGKRNHGRGQVWVDKPLRFSLKDHPCVSVKPRRVPQRGPRADPKTPSA